MAEVKKPPLPRPVLEPVIKGAGSVITIVSGAGTVKSSDPKVKIERKD